MAFRKNCISTVMKCAVCGKPGIFKQKENWFCQECSSTKKTEKKSLKKEDDEKYN